MLYAPLVLVTVNDSVPTRGVREKFAEVSVAVVLPSYGLIGLPIIAAVSVTAVMCPAPLAVVGSKNGRATCTVAGVKSPATRLAVTLLAVATSLLLYAPLVLVTVNDSVPTRGVREKFAEVSVAVVLPSYGLIGSPIIAAVSVTAVMCPAPLAVVGST